MKSIGFVSNIKENEYRRAVLPHHLSDVKHRSYLAFEEHYAAHMGVDDDAYRALGCRIVTRAEAFACDVVCSPKAPEVSEREMFGVGQTLFGWVHAVQGRAIVDFLLERRMTAIAWEDMDEDGRHCFWRNNELAGEAAVLHAVIHSGRAPSDIRAAVVGMGNCGRGAFRVLSQLGAEVTVFDRRSVSQLGERAEEFDVIVNAVMWDVFRTDHILTRDQVSRMRPGSLIIDVSCDESMGIETSRPTSIESPVYTTEGVIHYVVDHTPALLYRSATESVGRVVSRYLDQLVTGSAGQCLQRATVVREGVIVDDRVRRYQRR